MRRLPPHHLPAAWLRQARLLGPALLVLFGVLFGAAPPAESRPGYPKVANYYLSTDVDAERIQTLAKWDVLVLDAFFPGVNPGALEQIRSLNPDIIILGYIPINGTYVTGYVHEPETMVYRYWEGVDAGDFWLRSVDGSIVHDWPEKGSTNLTPHSPTNAQGEQFWEWFARFVYEEVWEEGNSEWDGIFLDDVWDKLSWLNAALDSPIDSDRNGVADDPATLDAWWRQGNELCTSRLRQLLGPGVPIVSNGGNTLYTQLNGTLLENFPYNGRPDQDNIYGYAWRKWMFDSTNSYFQGLSNYNHSPLSVMTINTHWGHIDGEPDRTGRFEAHKRLCLGSTLLGDGYFSLDADWDDHNSAWWEPEYDLYLGDPLGPAYEQVNGTVTLYRRDYEAGLVVVNPNNSPSYRTDTLPYIAPWDAYIGPPPDVLSPEPVSVAAAEAVDPHTVRLTWNAVFDPGGSGVASRYEIRYAPWPIDYGPPWIQATPIAQDLVPLQAGSAETLMVGGLDPNTTYTFCVRTYDSWDNISGIGVVPSATTPDDGGPPPVDVTPPGPISDLIVTGVDTISVSFRWTAVGDDGAMGTAAITHGRYAAQPVTEAGWDAAAAIPGLPAPAPAGTLQQSSLSGLAPGATYYLALRAEDEAGNLGPLGAVVPFVTDEPPPPPPPPPVDIEGPATVTDLAPSQAGESWVQLRFTAPADALGAVTGYDLRYREGAVFDPADWDGAVAAVAPAPKTPGTLVYALVNGLASGTQYAFRIRSVDDAGNWSDLSPAAVGLTNTPPPPPPADTTGPEPVVDLAVVGAGQTWLDLAFTAPADAEGAVTAYDLRYRAGAVFETSDWDQALPVSTGAPQAPGSAETIRVEGLAAGASYVFRIRSTDDAENLAALSEPVVGLTAVPPPPPPPPPPADTTAPAAVTDLVASVADTFLVRLTWTATGDDGAIGQAARYDLRWREGSLDAGSWSEAVPVSGMAPPLPSGWAESFVVANLPMETTLAFALVVEDSAGNRSLLSNPATIFLREPEPPDTRPPGTIEDLEILDKDAGRVTLQWAPGPEPDLSHYRLYRGRLPGGALTLYRDGLDTCRIEDRRVIPGRSYVYAVTAVDAEGNEGALSPRMEVLVPWNGHDQRPADYLFLGEPYPNPSPGRVQFSLETGAETVVRMEVFDVSGRRVRRLPEQSLPPGDFTLAWDGADDAGRRVGRGIYFLRVQAGATRLTKKIHLLP